MKRLLMTTIASLMLAGSLSLPAMAQEARGHSYQRGDRNVQGGSQDRGDRNAYQNRERGGDHDRGRSFSGNRGGDHRYDRGYDRNDSRGYDRTYGHGYGNRHEWRRGDRLGDWGHRYREVDYRDFRDGRLYRPPSGYRWVRDDNGDFLLAALAGGLIAAIVASN